MTAPTMSVPAATTTTLAITGMTCAGCVRRIERALAAVDGVSQATVNLATQNARVELDPARARLADLEAAVVAAGYGVAAPAPAPGVDDPTDPALTADPRAPAAGRSRAERDEQRSLRWDLALAAAGTVPLLALAMSHGAIAWADATAGRVLQFALGSLVVFGPGRRFLRGGTAALRHRSADMNTLVALGALAAWSWSTLATFAPHWLAAGGHGAPHVYFEAAAAIVAFVLLGKYLESRARWRLGDAVRALHALVPAVAHQVADGDPAVAPDRDVPVPSLRAGDLVRVRPGERAPADGVVVHGGSAVDESLLTGESTPVDKAPGARVVGGSLNTTGALVVRLDRTGAATALARVAAAVEAAQGSRAPIARFADRASAVFVPIVLAIAALTLGVWWLLEPSANGFALAIERAVAVLVIACPCALGLATPAAVAVGAGRGAALGVLFRTGAALEHASRIDTVWFDKTGTLTRGAPAVVAVEPTAGHDADELLRAAAAVELGSEHPFARAVVGAARARGLDLAPAEGFVAVPAMGVGARIGGELVRVGKPAWLAAEGVDVAAAVAAADGIAARGATPLLVARGRTVLGVLGVADPLRPEAAATIAQLRALGLRVGMLSGDRTEVANAIGGALGLDEIAAELLPAEKAARLVAAQRAGHRVAMVGDGVNDAPALAAADLGIAMGGGTDVAAAAADVALLQGGLGGVPVALALARATMRTIRRNLLWASIYNVLGIPLAAGALAGLGVGLSPVYASAAMSLSSVSVLASSLLLRRFAPAVSR